MIMTANCDLFKAFLRSILNILVLAYLQTQNSKYLGEKLNFIKNPIQTSFVPTVSVKKMH